MNTFLPAPMGVIFKELENNFFIFFLELFSSLEKKRIAARKGTATQCQFCNSWRQITAAKIVVFPFSFVETHRFFSFFCHYLKEKKSPAKHCRDFYFRASTGNETKNVKNQTLFIPPSIEGFVIIYFRMIRECLYFISWRNGLLDWLFIPTVDDTLFRGILHSPGFIFVVHTQ